MTRLRASSRWSWTVGVVLLLAGCAANPQRSAEERYLHAIEDANRVYSTTLVEAGRAHTSGALSDERLEQVRVAGHAVEAALWASRAALETWLVVNGADGGALDGSIAALRSALAALLAEARP